MIRICALDFLNRDSFESDIKLADGKVIISAGEKVTPELVLMLYFKEIYVDKPLPDIILSRGQSTSSSTPVEIPVINYEESVEGAFDAATSELSKDEQKVGLPQEVSFDLSAETSDKSVGDEDIATPFEKAPISDLGVETPIDTTSSDADSEASKYPNAPSFDLEDETPDNPLEGGVDYGKKYSEGDVVAETDDKFGKSPVAPSFDIDVTDDTTPAKAEEVAKSEVKEESVRVLKFDEDIAKEIAANAVKLARELNLSQETVSDIEKAALICNIGLDSFKIEDLQRKDFESCKAKVSYEMAMKQGIHSNEVLEIVKTHAKPYISENFSLASIIPAPDILHIACLYSRYLYVGMSKEQVINKMLQQGGNEYNIFALHKFLRLMRDE